MTILQLFSSVWVLIYASTIMALLLGVRPLELKGAKRIVLFVVLPCVFLLNLILMFLLDLNTFGMLYPLIGQLPVFLIFYYIAGKGFAKTFFSLLTTLFLTFPYSTVGMLIDLMHTPRIGLIILLSILASIIIALAIWRFIVPNFTFIMDMFSTKETFKFCFIPLFYNILTYVICTYTGGLVVWPLRCFLFVNTLVVYFLLMNTVRNASNMQILKSEKDMLFMQSQSAKNQIEQFRTLQDQTATYRHDLRHHITLLYSFAIDGDMPKIKDYLNQAQGQLDSITPIYFCENETVNLIFSAFDKKAKADNIELSVEACMPKELSITDTELCAMLSNGLENALLATSKVEQATRKVYTECFIKRDKLMLMIQNPYTESFETKNGIPISLQEGHGLGCRSIAAITDKRNGLCTFTAENNIFTLRVIIPLNKL